MTTYKELLQAREELNVRTGAARRAEIAGALAQIRTLIDDFDLSADDVFGGQGNAPQNGGGKVSRSRFTSDLEWPRQATKVDRWQESGRLRHRLNGSAQVIHLRRDLRHHARYQSLLSESISRC